MEVSALLNDGRAIVFCPPIDKIWFHNSNEIYFGEEHYSTVPGGIVYNETIQAGDTLTLAWLETDLSLEEAATNPDQIFYREAQLTLSAVMNEPFYMKRSYSAGDESREITIILSEESANRMDYIEGVFRFVVYMQEDISEAEYAAVQEQFGRVAYSISGTNCYSSREEEAFIRKMQYAHKMAFGILCVVMGGFIVISLFSTLYGTLLQRWRMFGILRANGLRKRQMFGIIYLELLIYWGGMAVLSYGLSIWCCYLFSVKVVNPFMEAADIWLLAGKVSIVLLGVMILLLGIAWLLTRRVWKCSVSEVIRFAE